MDITTLRIAATLVSFVTFVGILYWAFVGSKQASFDEAANIPFGQD